MKAQAGLEVLLVIAALAVSISIILPITMQTNEMSDYLMKLQKSIQLRDSIINGCRKVSLMGQDSSYSFSFFSPINYELRSEDNSIKINFEGGFSETEKLSQCEGFDNIKKGENKVTITNQYGYVSFKVNK